jgi:hypothetical protein
VIGGWTWDPDAALETTPNVVRGRYVDATTASLYQMIDYPEVRLPSPDGQDRIFALDLGVVESPSQAQRIAKQVLQRKQYPRAFTATFDIRAWKYAVGDVVPFTFAPLSFNRRLFRVQEQELGQGGACVMTLTVETAAIYAWDKDDAAPVLGAEPIVYDSRLSPLVLAIDEAATTADWSSVTGAARPADYADVTADAIDHSRFALCSPTDRIGTEIRSRFDPVFWTCNFPNTMIASLRASGGRSRTAEQREQGAGLFDPTDPPHPTGGEVDTELCRRALRPVRHRLPGRRLHLPRGASGHLLGVGWRVLSQLAHDQRPVERATCDVPASEQGSGDPPGPAPVPLFTIPTAAVC